MVFGHSYSDTQRDAFITSEQRDHGARARSFALLGHNELALQELDNAHGDPTQRYEALLLKGKLLIEKSDYDALQSECDLAGARTTIERIVAVIDKTNEAMKEATQELAAAEMSAFLNAVAALKFVAMGKEFGVEDIALQFIRGFSPSCDKDAMRKAILQMKTSEDLVADIHMLASALVDSVRENVAE